MGKDAFTLYNRIKAHYNNPDNEVEPGWRTERGSRNSLANWTSERTVVATISWLSHPRARSSGKTARIEWEGSGGGTRSGILTLIKPRGNRLSEEYTLTTGSLLSDVRSPDARKQRPRSATMRISENPKRLGNFRIVAIWCGTKRQRYQQSEDCCDIPYEVHRPRTWGRGRGGDLRRLVWFRSQRRTHGRSIRPSRQKA